MKNLNDLFQDTICDIYDSENQLLKGMAEMVRASKSPRLQEAIQSHIAQTEGQVRRIEEICDKLGFSPKGTSCQATVGLVKEAQEHIKKFGGTPAGDAAIIACAQKCEHYEICNYGTAIEWAELLGFDEIAEMLELTLTEEEGADDLLTEIAESEVNEKAMAMAGSGASLI